MGFTSLESDKVVIQELQRAGTVENERSGEMRENRKLDAYLFQRIMRGYSFPFGIVLLDWAKIFL